MVRTELRPRPFQASSNKTSIRVGTEINDNGVKGTTFNIPNRVKLKARRRFSEKPQKLIETLNIPASCKDPNVFNGENNMKAPMRIRHKRQKSLHKILSNVHVNI